MTDRLARLMNRIAAEEPDALRELYVATSAKIFGIVLRIVRDRVESEDVLQEVYLKIWRGSARFDITKGSVVSWLCVIGRNHAIDYVRKRRVSSEPIDRHVIVDPEPSPETHFQQTESWTRLEESLANLRPQQSSAIHRAFFDGLTYEELALQAKVPVGTMKSWIRRGLLQLRESLDEGDGSLQVRPRQTERPQRLA